MAAFTPRLSAVRKYFVEFIQVRLYRVSIMPYSLPVGGVRTWSPA